MVHYRKFRNTDPPLITDIWNESLSGRGSIPLQSATPLERYVFSKPYFDPEGLVLAEEDGKVLGFVHAAMSMQQPTLGVISVVLVRPSARRRGIGAELVRRAETYLREHGAKAILAGAKGTANPFYLGMYGGSDSAGFMTSDVSAEPFLQKLGYQVKERILIFQRDLAAPVKVVDPRFAKVRQRYDLRVRSPRKLCNFAEECDLGAVEPLEFYLEDRQTTKVGAHTFVWEMEGFGWRWGRPSVGLVGFEVVPELRRQGVGKYLLTSLLRQLQEQYFEIVELHLDESNKDAIQFVQDVGFRQVDVGQVFERGGTGS